MIYPAPNPIALDLGVVQIYWYGIMYLFAFLASYLLARHRIKSSKEWDVAQVEDLIFYGAFGVIVGGRLGYMLFYNLQAFIESPLSVFSLQGGGMSFHGGLLGVIVAIYIFNKKYNKSFFITADFIAPLIPLGLGFGRLGNFINGELWGKITTSDFGMYIQSEGVIRFPSQLYEALLEGIVLFIILWLYSSKPKPTGYISALFLIFYSLFRFFVEFVRLPDSHIGYLAHDWLTMGQALCIPMFLLGLFLLYFNRRSL